MPFKRLIPVLLIKEDGLIHRSKFDENTDLYVGDPINTINIFNDYEVDELILLDVSARKQSKNINFNLLEEIAGEAFFPLAYGGFLQNIEECEKIIKIGFEKIILNSCTLGNFNFLSETIKQLGSQSVILSLNLIRNENEYYIFDYINKKIVKENLFDFINFINSLKVGEILINSVNLDGTMLGSDKKLIELFHNKLDIPLIYKGGIKNYKEINDIFNYKIDAIASSTIFIMKKKGGGIVLNYPTGEEKNKFQ